MKPHQVERLSHEYKRNGTASLLAALEVHSGQVKGQSIRRNNSETFIRFLRRLLQAYPDKELYVVLDTGSSNGTKKPLAWFLRKKRLPLNFLPPKATW